MLIGMAGAAIAQGDARMSVRIDFEEGEQLSLQQSVSKALPTLWDRIVMRVSRDAVPNVNATSLLLKAVPDASGVLVEFNPQRTFDFLKQNRIEYIEQQPRLNLVIQMWNQNGIEMIQSEQLLLQEAHAIADQRGLILDESGASLILNWRWLDGSTVSYMQRGNSALPESGEIRSFGSGDPLEQLRVWISDTLLAARDAEASAKMVAGGESQPGKIRTAEGIETVLIIERAASLPEQVILEEALEKHPAVAALIPKFISFDTRQYRLLLKGQSDEWVPSWFRRRGMQVSPTPQGWLVQ